MSDASTRVFEDLTVDYVEFYVSDLAANVEWLSSQIGLAVVASSEAAPNADPETSSVALGHGRIRLVLTRPRVADHPATAYLERHGDGVCGIALGVPDAGAAFAEAVRRGAVAVSPPAWRGGLRTATIMGFGDLTHTFVERAAGTDEHALPGLAPLAGEAVSTGLETIDHFAVCVEPGQLDATAEFYERTLDFATVFGERIEVGDQAIETKAVQSRSGAVTLTLIEPDVSRTAGQIDDFLKNHGGPGVQHIALSTADIVRTVTRMSEAGMAFLATPAAYYDMLRERLAVTRHPTADLQRLGILVDEDHDGQLFQIFARSRHPRRTVFFEIIERMGARTFGGNNINALYRAVELQRRKEQGES